MPARKTKFRTEWITTGYPFVDKSNKGEYFAYCTFCQKDVSIGGRGVADLRAHVETEKHQTNSKNFKVFTVESMEEATTTTMTLGYCANCLDPLSNRSKVYFTQQEGQVDATTTTTIQQAEVVGHSTVMQDMVSSHNSTFHNNDLYNIGHNYGAASHEKDRINVNVVLSEIYNLNYLNTLKSENPDDGHGHDADDEEMKICSQCSQTLSTLYKFYDDFNQLRRLGSVLDKRIKKLDHMIHKFQVSPSIEIPAATTTTTSSMLSDDEDFNDDDDAAAADACSSFEEEEEEEKELSNLILNSNIKKENDTDEEEEAEIEMFVPEKRPQIIRKLKGIDNSGISGPPWVKIQKLADTQIAATSDRVNSKKSYKQCSDEEEQDEEVEEFNLEEDEDYEHRRRSRRRKNYKKYTCDDDDKDFDHVVVSDDDDEPSDPEPPPRKPKKRSKAEKVKKNSGRKRKKSDNLLDELAGLGDLADNKKSKTSKSSKSTHQKSTKPSPSWKQLITILAPDGTPGTTKTVKEAVRRYSCTVCGNIFNSWTGVKSHVFTHLGGRPHKCTFAGCSMSCMTKYELNSHMITHSGEKFQCHLCQKLLSSPQNLSVHIKVVHEGLKPFLCSLCGHTFSQNSALTKHLPVHSEERNFKCDFCGKTFKQKHSLSKHIGRFHSEKRHLCPSCGMTFNCAEKLKRHGKRYHSSDQQAS